MYEFKATEEKILKFWKGSNIYEKAAKKNKGKKKFYFLQGPPYTSGRIHIGHAWNNSLKDMLLRYKRMQGLDVWDRAGYDMHGLPTERKVQALHKLDTKEDIIKFGMEKFIRECIKWSTEKAKLMDEDLFKIGVWMDYENAYWPIKNEYIEGVWWLIKQADRKKRLYEGLRTMSWCPNCATAMAKHECEYKTLKEESIFVKLKAKGTKNEYIIIWTTTPWTIAYNLAVMANPELDYVKADVEGETWIVAKGLAGPVIQAVAGKKFKILKEMKGSELEGMEYEHPWHREIEEFPKLKKQHPKVHTVILSEEYVTLDAGSGLVHCAPGCGPEDYEVGHRNNIPPFNNLTESGTFPKGMGRFSGLKAKADDKKFTKALEDAGALIEVTPVEHEYAHCERCHSPVIFRATKQWFFKTEDLKERMRSENSKVHWVPETGKNAFDSWLANLRDNSITKQRFWGTPAPIWKCGKCSMYTVAESKADLQKLKAKNIPENLHKPWIDAVTIECKCGGTMHRIPDVLDVWIDAGCASWICLYYPQRKELLAKWFPADFILEAKEQVRGWFNLLMVTSILAMDKPSFKRVYMHGMLTDVEGQKMSKSLGNIISPYEFIDKFGADTLRFYMCRTAAGEDINFSWEEAKLKYKNLSILWNVCQYLLDYTRAMNVNPAKAPKGKNSQEEEAILSRLHSTISQVTEAYESYQLDKVPALLENLFLDLSRTYIQATRDKASSEPEIVLHTIYTVMTELLKMLATVCPFISEELYQTLKREYKLKEESVHLMGWPKADKKKINKKLEGNFAIAEDVMQAILAAREKANIGVRWPLSKATIITRDSQTKKAVQTLKDMIKQQVNVKEVATSDEMKGGTVHLSENKAAIGKDFKSDAPKILAAINSKALDEIYNKGKAAIGSFELTRAHINIKETLPQNIVSAEFKNGVAYIDTQMTEELEKEGYARELTRRVQAMRKELGLKKADRIGLAIDSPIYIVAWKEEIQQRVGAKTLKFEKLPKGHEERIKDKIFKISVKKL